MVLYRFYIQIEWNDRHTAKTILQRRNIRGKSLKRGYFVEVSGAVRKKSYTLFIQARQRNIIIYLFACSMSLPFAILIPGQPVITQLQCTNGIYHVDIPNPKSIANISIFLTAPIPQNYALTLNFSLPPYNEMQYLGAIANEKPSDTFMTGFPFRSEFDTINTVKLCLQGQSYEEIANLVKCSDGQKEYSKLVAHNLFNFMMSYHNGDMLVNNANNGREYLVLPSDVFTKWMNKFDEKYAKDPNFILKTTIE